MTTEEIYNKNIEKLTELSSQLGAIDPSTVSDPDNTLDLYKKIAPMLLNVLIGLNKTVQMATENEAKLRKRISQLESELEDLKKKDKE